MVGLSDRNKFGRVALIGPLTNLVMGFGFLISTYLYPYHSYLYAGASFNAWIAMFNLLPFGTIFKKIFDWNKIAWGCAMAITMVLLVVANLDYDNITCNNNGSIHLCINYLLLILKFIHKRAWSFAASELNISALLLH